MKFLLASKLPKTANFIDLKVAKHGKRTYPDNYAYHKTTRGGPTECRCAREKNGRLKGTVECTGKLSKFGIIHERLEIITCTWLKFTTVPTYFKESDCVLQPTIPWITRRDLI